MNSIVKPLQVAFFLSAFWLQSPASAQTIAAGDNHSLAICTDGTLMVWGANQNGQLGLGTFVDGNVPVQINNLRDVVAVSAGENHSIALKSDGTVWTWATLWKGSWEVGISPIETLPDKSAILQV